MLDEEFLQVVLVCMRPDLTPDLTSACIEQVIAVMSEKPLAMDLATLTKLYEQALERDVLVLPMHAMRRNRALATVSSAIRTGTVGSPLVSSHQKSYKWGRTRPDYSCSRRTFPGIAPWVGIHAFDWMVWMMGDACSSVYGGEAMTARQTYAGCASQAGYVFEMRNGCVAVVSLDYLRPEAAASHGDERESIAGSKGIVESALIEDKVTLITSDQGLQSLALVDVPYRYTTFVQAVAEKTRPFMHMWEAFRITETALKAQQPANEGRPVSFEESPYRPSRTSPGCGVLAVC